MLTGRMCDQLRKARETVEGYRELKAGMRVSSPVKKLLLKRYKEAQNNLCMLLKKAYSEEMEDDMPVPMDYTCGVCRYRGVDVDLPPCRSRGST